MCDTFFTPQMRDRQARGKDPYHAGDGSDDADLGDGESGARVRLRLGSGRVEQEDFSTLERRQKAIAFLDNPELLMMYAQSTGDSIPGARLHFMKMLCGYGDEEAEHASRGSAHAQARRDMHHHRQADQRRRAGDHQGSGN
ncbi:hypothetical protein VTK56DRAFT_6527 [Thermocarpiscus australiensis]